MKTYSVDIIIETSITVDFETDEKNPSKVFQDAYDLILESRKKEELFDKKGLALAKVYENGKVVKTFYGIHEVEDNE